MNWIAKLIWNNYNDKHIAKLQPLVKAINEYDEQWMSLTDAEVQAKTWEFKSRFQAGESLDDLLPEAFAAVKQACRRMVGQSLPVKDTTQTWDMVPYDVQLIGWIVLHQGKIAEMRTGEGKTLVATLPAYLNALSGNPVHVVTVNDYLASRDAEWMWHLYKWLWLTVGSINKYTPQHEHKAQYESDIIYVESTEIGFDYLRDNLEKNPDNRRLLNRGLHFAIVDEADSVFIDEARTPMIMSQPNNDPIDKYVRYAEIVKTLVQSSKAKKVSKWFLAELMKNDEPQEDTTPDGDYYLDEKSKAVTLSEVGISKLEQIMWVENIYRDLGYDEIHHIENALSAKAAYHEGKEYIIQGDEVMIVDENTGRIMPGRRFQWGLHQAIEAKEKISIKQEAKTIATITYQHFFKLYGKLSGMTGTATTEWEELEKIYDLEVLSIPTNKPITRVDRNDRIFFDQNSKWQSTIKTVQFYHSVGQPILIGTSSIHTSELVSTLLRQANINHYVLNAKFFEQEATIVGNGGQYGSVVVATNMAGRGTDIKLEKWLNDKIAINYATWIKKHTSDQWEVWLTLNIASQWELDLILNALWDDHGYTIQTKITTKQDTQPYATLTITQSAVKPTQYNEVDVQFGLFVLGTEKHESRRIDNQLRGRAGRQWDPGVSQFYVSFDDEIMRKMWWSSMQSILAMAGRFAGNQEEMEQQLSSQSMFTNSIVRAQTQMEAHNYSIRKHLYDYDSVVNKQRLKVYGKRDEILQDKKQGQGQQEVKVILVDAVRGIINSNEAYDSDTWSLNLELAEYLKTLPQRKIIVTNAAGEKIDFIKEIIKSYGFEIVSYENNPSKTNSEYFSTLLSTFNLQPWTALYFDHKQENLDSASEAGITNSFLHTDTQATIEQLGLRCKPSNMVRYETVDQSPIYTEVKWWISEVVANIVAQHRKLGTSDAELLENLKQDFVIGWDEQMTAEINHKSNLTDTATRLLESQIDRWSGFWDATQVHQYMKNLYLEVLDEQWIEHIDTMQHLRDKVGLYGYAQQDPLLIYKAESYDLFEQLWLTIKSKVLNTIFRQIQQHDDQVKWASQTLVVESQNVVDVSTIMTNTDEFAADIWDTPIQTVKTNTSKVSPNVQVVTKADSGKVWPNDLCPCGSGKKYKKCHGGATRS
jgi:preprotein translocase subunit SecA